jgi:EAL domain-containing protein (putative c-di-GMP-specific phosphodiesterase class I)/CRP-like cAMP-binding protein
MKITKKSSPMVDLHQLRSFYPKGTVLFQEKDERNCAYIIETGEVEISVLRDGQKVSLVRLGQGEVFGETALLGVGKRTATAIATQDCEVFCIFPNILRDRIMQLDPLVGLLMSLLVSRYRQWRYISPDQAFETNTVQHTSEDLKHIDKADDFMKDLNTQKQVALKELRLAQEIIEAVVKNELGPYMQPILSLKDNKLMGFEMLIRWHHPTGGVISPMDFVPVAERTNIIWHLDLMMLQRACKAVADVQKATGRQVYVSVNLSGVHFNSEDLSERIIDVVRESGVEPSLIVLEITESALMGNAGIAEKILHHLKAFGLTIALDDFGTGYSSLSYLHHFSIDILKIDKSFINDIHNKNGKSLDVVRAIVSLAKTFGLKIVAEGIEYNEDVGTLSSLGCDTGQGYLFSKPMPVEQALEFAAENVRQFG